MSPIYEQTFTKQTVIQDFRTTVRQLLSNGKTDFNFLIHSFSDCRLQRFHLFVAIALMALIAVKCGPLNPTLIRADNDHEVDVMDKGLDSDYGEGVEDEVQTQMDAIDNGWVKDKDGLWDKNEQIDP